MEIAMLQNRVHVNVCVVGAGHAGCEAALACARLGLETVIFTVSVDSIALMPCNPNVGGTSKGHLVREIDARQDFYSVQNVEQIQRPGGPLSARTGG